MGGWPDGQPPPLTWTMVARESALVLYQRVFFLIGIVNLDCFKIADLFSRDLLHLGLCDSLNG